MKIGQGNIFLTSEGGLAVRFVNKTGAASVKGYVVDSDGTTTNGVGLIAQNIPDPIGVIYTNGVPDGGYIYVVVAGIADVYYTGTTTVGNLCRGFVTADGGAFVAGQALNEALPTTPFANDKHFYEIGHVLEARTGAGLAKTLIHFN